MSTLTVETTVRATVVAFTGDVLRHRVAITYGAEEKISETTIQKIFDELPVP